MNEKQQTPLAKSIQRKVDRKKELEELFKDRPNNDFLDGQLFILDREITEDKKLLPEERGNMINARGVNIIQEFGQPPYRQTGAQWFNENYTQEIQEDQPTVQIPKMTHPLSKGWRQPEASELRFVGDIVEMNERAFSQLYEYSYTLPSGVYAGKMWKSQDKNGNWYLRWFVDIEGNKCRAKSMQISIRKEIQEG